MDATGQGEVFRVVRLFDPAVRWSDIPRADHLEVSAYASDRDFAAVEKAVEPGKRPMVFNTRRLRRSVTRDVSSAATDEMRHQLAFMHGVESVEMPDGTIARPTRETWSEDDLDRCRFDFVDIDDIGKVVLQRSRLPFGSPAYFVAPRSSAAASAALLFHSAAQSPSAAAPSRNEPEAASGS